MQPRRLLVPSDYERVPTPDTEYKRLYGGRFRWRPASRTKAAKTLAAHQLQALLSAGNPEATKAAPTIAELASEPGMTMDRLWELCWGSGAEQAEA